MRLRRHHVILSGAVIAVAVMLGFAVSFLVDASTTNRTYDALSAHRVALSGHQLGCAWVGPSSRSNGGGTVQVCRIAGDYRGQYLTWVISFGQSDTLFVDPHDPSIRMTETTFNNGPRETTGDIAIGILLIFGAGVVATLHELHRRHRHRRRASRVGHSERATT
jgi:hypothetical protein